MPKTEKEWNWVLSRIDLNFGDIFSSLSRESYIRCWLWCWFSRTLPLEKGFTKIDAIDLSEEQIRVAKEKLAEHSFEYTNKVKFYVANAFDYLREAKGYDVISYDRFFRTLH